MSRFDETFTRLRQEGACGLFPYLTAGFPDQATSQALAETALAAGADGFEIGVPFSDPMADGATLQRANALALERGATPETALALARFIRERSPATPVALMSYYNPVVHRGDTAFAAVLAEAGADALIVPDLPVEESAGLDRALADRGLDFIQMLAPTSSPQRIQRAAARARGFVYCVALVGVTGARTTVSGDLAGFLARVRAETDVPLVVGFGISTAEHVGRVARLGAQGAIVASALADLVERAPEPVPAARAFLAELKQAGRTGGPVAAVG